MDQLIGLFIALLVFFFTSRGNQKQKKRASEDPHSHSEGLLKQAPHSSTDGFDKLPQDVLQKRVPTRRRIKREVEHENERQKYLSRSEENHRTGHSDMHPDLVQNQSQGVLPLPPQVEFLGNKRANMASDLAKASGRTLMIHHEILSPPKVFRKDSK